MNRLRGRDAWSQRASSPCLERSVRRVKMPAWVRRPVRSDPASYDRDVSGFGHMIVVAAGALGDSGKQLFLVIRPKPERRNGDAPAGEIGSGGHDSRVFLDSRGGLAIGDKKNAIDGAIVLDGNHTLGAADFKF